MILIHLFAADIPSPELAAMGKVALRIISVGYIFVAFTLIAQGFFQALGNGASSLILTLMRVVVVLLLVLFILSRTVQLDGIWRAFVMAEGASAAVGVLLIRRTCERRIRPLALEEEPAWRDASSPSAVNTAAADGL